MEYLVSLQEIIKSQEDVVMDYYWEEKPEFAQAAERFLEELYTLRDKGEIYYPLF